MQDIVERNDAGIPGIRSIPILGDLLSSRADLSRKTELVIFLRATVIHDPSLEGDFASLREQMPTADFFSRPNPTRIAPPVGPDDRPLR
jgi:general secretion pathway protein D